MEFLHTLVSSQEAQKLSLFPSTDSDLRFGIIDAINTAIVADTLTATVVVSGATQSVRELLLVELKQMGYAVDGTTTPGSWIISWS